MEGLARIACTTAWACGRGRRISTVDWAGQLLERRHTCCLRQQPFLAAPAQRCCCALAVSWAQAAAEKFNIDVSGCSVLDFLDTSNPLVEK